MRKIDIVDQDVANVAAYMQKAVPRANLYRTAKALSKLAELIWARYDSEEDFYPFGLVSSDDLEPKE